MTLEGLEDPREGGAVEVLGPRRVAFEHAELVDNRAG